MKPGYLEDNIVNDPVERAMDRADERPARIIAGIADHFPGMAPSIRAVAWHVVANVDGEARADGQPGGV
jgi:hypothetical protein